ncbi:MAG: MATE family efflux transporter [Lachnospiraceae bacterium]|nr:MATE family efflux transporter [Lachnospiraceae bacterium]MDD7050012.1 MATE family efflux transporter [Lachnospiraceae bacterium]MDY4095520.1 MATE family efflux transporter [Lachnospiraceae bacterium]
MKNKQEVNKMAVMPVNKLMLNMGIPMILSMALQAVYNIVDTVFVSKMQPMTINGMTATGDHGLQALGLVFPAQMMMIAIAIGTGVGVNALLAKCMGQNDGEKVARVAGNGVFLGAIIYIFYILFGIFGVRAYIDLQNCSEQVTAEMAISYLQICSIVSFGVVFFSLFEKLLQATGRSMYSTVAQVTGAVVNIILDPVLIYGLGPFEPMGIEGAAWATVVGQIASALLGLIFHLKKNREIAHGWKYKKPNLMIIKQVYAIGLPAIIAQALMSLMSLAMNVLLIQVNDDIMTAYTTFYKIQQFVLFCAFGLRDAITPIVAFNHGLRNQKRVNDGIKYGMQYTIMIMAVGMLCVILFANPISHMFTIENESIRKYLVEAMHFVSLSFIFAGINIACQGIFQALDSGLQSLLISLFRQAVFILPLVYAGTRLTIQNGDLSWLIWLTFLITELATAVIAFGFMQGIRKRKVSILL